MLKLTKEKITVEKEEIEIKDGTYYFSCNYKGDAPYLFKKIVVDSEETWDNGADLKITTVKDDGDEFSCHYEETYTDGSHWWLELYFAGKKDEEKEYKEISEEQFNKVKERILNKLK